MADKRSAKSAKVDSGATPPKKKQKLTTQTFRQEYTNKYPEIVKSHKGASYAHCTTCYSHFTISHGGENDVKKHLQTQKHCSNKASTSDVNKIGSFFVKSDTKQEYAITKAECLFTSLIVEHNLPIAVADHVTKILPKMFPDSEIAKKYACARTKTTAIIEQMAVHAVDKTVSVLSTKPFCLSTDGSNDVDSKLYPIVLSYFDDSEGRVVQFLLSIPNLVGKSTGVNIAELLQEELAKRNLQWDHCIALGVDNANVMIGTNKGVAGNLLKLNPEMVIRGCPCHLLHLAAEKASKKLHYQFDEILVDIFYYFEKSANRKQDLHQFQDMYDADNNKVLKHVCTRWLSLGQCLERMINQWVPLKAFFTEKHEQKKKEQKKKEEKHEEQKKKEQKKKEEKSSTKKTGNVSENKQKGKENKGPGKKEQRKVEQKEQKKKEEKSSKKTEKEKEKKQECEGNSGPSNTYLREERLYRLLTSRRCIVYALFLNYTIKMFDTTNMKLQAEEPLVHKLQRILLGLYRNILTKFVFPQAIIDCADILDVDFNDKQTHVTDDSIDIGYEIEPFLLKLDSSSKAAFYNDVKDYYQTCLEYMRNKFPLRDATLKHAEVADVSLRIKASFKSIEYFALKLKPVLEVAGTPWSETMNSLKQQFAGYQVDSFPGLDTTKPCNLIWKDISGEKDELGQAKYDKLSALMQGILVIPHSNAGCERIFSLVRKNRTDFRGSMSNSTLEALLITKQDMSGSSCYEQQFSTEFLQKAKSATYHKLK